MTRLRTFTLWTGMLLCVLIAAAIVALGWSMHSIGTPVWEFISGAYPLFYPFLSVVALTLLGWRFWPKPVKPGHCRCGYDLRGNVSGVCPECGAAT